MDRPKGIGMKYRYLMLIFKIVLLESLEVETDYLMTNGRKIVQTDGNNLLYIGIWCHTLPTKKKKFENRTVRTAFDDFVFLSIRLYEQIDRQKVQKIGI